MPETNHPRPTARGSHDADVLIGSGTDTLDAYFALPASDTPVPAAVMLHDVFGVRDVARRQARRLAAHGVAALFPHLLRGVSPFDPSTDPNAAKTALPHLRSITVQQCLADISSGLDYLRGRPEVDSSRLVVWGYCWGGKMALRAAAKPMGQAATVVWHGMLKGDELGEVDSIQGPILGLFGGADKTIAPETINALASHCEARRVRTDFHVFPGAPHSFCDDTREANFHRESCEQAWLVAAQFIRKHLSLSPEEER